MRGVVVVGGANKFDGLRGLFVYLRKRLRHFFSVFDFCTYKSGDLADLSVGFSVLLGAIF